jgi:hypothetical protein
VEKITNDTCFHIDILKGSTLSYVGRVKENDYLTLKQMLKNVATTKQSSFILQACGNSKTETPT